LSSENNMDKGGGEKRRPPFPDWVKPNSYCSSCRGRNIMRNPDYYYSASKGWIKTCSECLRKRKEKRETMLRRAEKESGEGKEAIEAKEKTLKVRKEIIEEKSEYSEETKERKRLKVDDKNVSKSHGDVVSTGSMEPIVNTAPIPRTDVPYPVYMPPPQPFFGMHPYTMQMHPISPMFNTSYSPTYPYGYYPTPSIGGDTANATGSYHALTGYSPPVPELARSSTSDASTISSSGTVYSPAVGSIQPHLSAAVPPHYRPYLLGHPLMNPPQRAIYTSSLQLYSSTDSASLPAPRSTTGEQKESNNRDSNED